MQALLKISWLIPAIPLLGSLFVAVLLASFNRTINRLTKPISFFLISCVLLSTLFSILFLVRHVSGQSYEGDLNFASLSFHFSIYLNLFVEKLLSITGLTISVILISSYYLLDRRKGYVLYITSLSALSGLLSFLILNGFVQDLLM